MRAENIFVKADKTKHVYRMSKKQYSKLLQENVTKNYKLAPDTAFTSIKLEAKELAKKLEPGLDERREIFVYSDSVKQILYNSIHECDWRTMIDVDSEISIKCVHCSMPQS